jgi:hypothetical protein
MKKITLFLFLLASVEIACNGIFTTPISRIIDNPRDYEGKTVTISGEVTETFSFFVLKYFVVDDGTGTITVITQKALPKKGSKIRVKGKVNEMFSLGNTQALVIIEDPGKKDSAGKKEQHGNAQHP